MAEQNKKFQLGQIVATQGAIHEVQERENEIFAQLLKKHSNLEQGDLCDEDYQQNLDAVKNEGKKDNNGELMQDRVFSSYKIGEIKFWVISEWDRSVTTILLPSEY
jgi:hypothetical protein